MRELRCICRAQPAAVDAEDLAQKVLEHERAEHPETGLTEEEAREMVAS